MRHQVKVSGQPPSMAPQRAAGADDPVSGARHAICDRTGRYKALDQWSAGHVPVHSWLSVPSTAAQVIPLAADPVPTPEVSAPLERTLGSGSALGLVGRADAWAAPVQVARLEVDL